MTDEKKTRKTNPLQWSLKVAWDDGSDLSLALREYLPKECWPLRLCFGPEHDGRADANAWLLEHGKPVDNNHDLMRITARGVRIEQKRSLVQGSDD
jgi:hypothetical protein